MNRYRPWISALTAGAVAIAAFGLPLARIDMAPHTWTAAALETAQGLEYQIQADGTAMITGCSSRDTAIQIPETIAGATVTAIGADAFGENTAAVAIELPTTVTRIGSGALSGGTIRRIAIPGDSCQIAADAFGDPDQVVLSGWADSATAQFAAAHGYVFLSHTRSAGTGPGISLATVQITPEQLAARDYTLTLDLWMTQPGAYGVVALGMTLADGVAYVEAGTDTGALCIPSERNQFVWFPLVQADAQDAVAFGYITLTLPKAAAEGDTYAIALAAENYYGSPATIDGEMPQLLDGAVVLGGQMPVVTTTTTSVASTTTTTTTTTTIAAPTGLLGDVNQNGRVEIADAYQALMAYARSSAGLASELDSAQTWAADIDGDGAISLQDAYRILSYYAAASAGLEPSW